MELTSREILEAFIITNVSVDGIQQQGIDVRVNKISKVSEYVSGVIPKEGKSTIPGTIELPTNNGYYSLQPGYYEVELMEGCDIPSDAALHFKTRSSLVRCGAIVHSGQFDAGFKTDNMGCFLHVIHPIVIEKGARIAQAIVFSTSKVRDEDLYDGQWQNDKQRKQ